MASLNDCERLCLQEKQFQCLSFNFMPKFQGNLLRLSLTGWVWLEKPMTVFLTPVSVTFFSNLKQFLQTMLAIQKIIF